MPAILPNHDAQLWFQSNVNRVAITRAAEAIASLGQALPCHVVAVSGAIVTVAFDVKNFPQTLPQVTIPKAEGPWIRSPTQVGDKGVTVPASSYVANAAALGPDIAYSRPFNLSALLFVPISSAASPPSNPNAAIIGGPNGAIMNVAGASTPTVVVSPDASTLTFGQNTVTVNSDGITLTGGGKTVTINGAGVTIDGILFETHVHGGVQTGAGLTAPPEG